VPGRAKRGPDPSNRLGIDMARYKSPEERATEVVEKLTGFIQKNEGITGRMSYKTWQQLAQAEIAETVREAEKRRGNVWDIIQLVVQVTFVTIATIAFWAAVSFVYPSVGNLGVLGIASVGAAIAVTFIVRAANRTLK